MNKQKLAGIFSSRLAVAVSLLFLGVAGVLGFSFINSQPAYAQSLAPDGPKNCSKTGGDFSTNYRCTNYITSNNKFVPEGTCRALASTTCDPTFVRDATSAEIAQNTGGGSGDGEGEETEAGPQCGVDGGLGWIVCPTSWLIARVIDGAQWFIEQLLYVEPLSLKLDTRENAIYAIWSAIRNIANVLFVAAFLVIIFSQATSFGISNYGIKRMLPRLIVSAILVNLSYFICAIGIEASNLVGSSVDSLLDAIVAGTNLGGEGNRNTDLASFEGVVLAFLFGAGAAGTVAAVAPIGISGLLASLLPILVMAAFAIFVTIAVLVARQAFIIMLVVLSPLAFVAYLLPNTEGLYKKWVKGFMVMLIFYPLVIILYSGSQVAAAILRGATGNPLLEVFSLGVQVMPLFAMPFLFKIAGGVLNRFAGIVNHPEKGPFDKWRKSAEGKRDRTIARSQSRAAEKLRSNVPDFKSGKFRRTRKAAFGAFTTRGKLMTETDNERKMEEAKRIKNRGMLDYHAESLKDEDYARDIAGGRKATDTNVLLAQARGIEAQDKLIGEEAQAGRTVIEDKTLSTNELVNLAAKGMAVEKFRDDGTPETDPKLRGALYQKAAIGMLASQARVAHMERVLDNTSEMDDGMKEYLAYQLNNNYAAFKPKGHYLNSDEIKQSLVAGKVIDSATRERGTKMMINLVPEQFASQDNEALVHLRNAIEHGSLDETSITKARALAEKTFNEPQVQRLLTPQTKVTLQQIIAQETGKPPVKIQQTPQEGGTGQSTAQPSTDSTGTLYVHGTPSQQTPSTAPTTPPTPTRPSEQPPQPPRESGPPPGNFLG